MKRIQRHHNARSFLDDAEDWLYQSEAEHTLILGIARKLAQSTDAFEPPVYLATVKEDERIVGCAFRTPPYKFGMTRLPAAAIPPLVEDVAKVYESLPAAMGP